MFEIDIIDIVALVVPVVSTVGRVFGRFVRENLQCEGKRDCEEGAEVIGERPVWRYELMYASDEVSPPHLGC